MHKKCWNGCDRSQAGISRHCRWTQAEDTSVAVVFDFCLQGHALCSYDVDCIDCVVTQLNNCCYYCSTE